MGAEDDNGHLTVIKRRGIRGCVYTATPLRAVLALFALIMLINVFGHYFQWWTTRSLAVIFSRVPFHVVALLWAVNMCYLSVALFRSQPFMMQSAYALSAALWAWTGWMLLGSDTTIVQHFATVNVVISLWALVRANVLKQRHLIIQAKERYYEDGTTARLRDSSSGNAGNQGARDFPSHRDKHRSG